MLLAAGPCHSKDARKELWGEFRLPGDYTAASEQNQRLLVEFDKQLEIGDFGI